MHDLSLYLLELLENSVRAGATTIAVSVAADGATDRLTIKVDDDGRGLSGSAEQALDPFFTTKHGKRTGLGLTLLRADAEAAGGGLTIGASATLGGVAVEVWMGLSHVDRPPVGDIHETLAVMVATNPGISFAISIANERSTLTGTGTDVISGRLGADTCAAILESARTTPHQMPAGRPSRTAPPMTAEVTVEPVERRKEKTMPPEAQTCTCCEDVAEEELLRRLDAVIDDYMEKPGALIPVLQLAQGIFGYLPEVALKRIATRMRKPYGEVAGVVGFYSFFTTQPRGRHLVRVCLGTACYVRGGMAVLDALKKNLGVDVGETTDDRLFSLEVARCFGACGLAPVVTVDDDVHHRVKAARVGLVLDQYRVPVATAERSA